VPKFYAALILGTNPERYGFRVEPLHPHQTEMVTVDFSVDFEVLGECSGVSAETLADLNPALIRRCTPPNETGFLVAVPVGASDRAAAALAKLPEDKRVRWAHHRVRRGETLSHIADNYRTTVYAIAEANHLRNAHLLSIGQDLLIPQGRRSGANPPRYASSSGKSSSRSSSKPSGREKMTYVVRKGDTLSEIADRYRTSSRMIRKWNSVGRFIYPGDRLTIWVKSGTKVASGSNGYTVRVRRGDTLWEIARHHGVSLSSLLRANGLKNSHLIRPGDVIKVPPRTSG
jgi:membrane-bound lytic murein transglycosylase D